MAETSHHLADQALANLVNQFARPLDFLRELAQNSIDAGTPRIAISVEFEPKADDPSQGVLEIHVEDFGEGMDERIIDQQLTRLFSSTKEDDLTKIGKFGIGFTSIFAIQPQAVLLRTGRHGEYWELLFHEDRTYEKHRIEEPVAGTKITLFKRMKHVEVAAFVQEARFVLGYWCQHSDVPISWWDRTTGTPEPSPDDNDPFAAFSSPGSEGGPQQVNRPLTLDESVLSVRFEDEGTEIVAGLCATQRYGFYNGGLTLLETRSEDCLGEYRDAVAHLSFKIKNDRLEHTLTRDNVLHDEHFHRAMNQVLHVRDRVLEHLLTRTEQAAANGQDLADWHRWLARDRAGRDEPDDLQSLMDRLLFRDHKGTPISLSQIASQESELGFVLLASRRRELNDTVSEAGWFLVSDTPATRRLLHACASPAMFSFLDRERTLLPADEAFVMPQVMQRQTLEPAERALLEATEAYLGAAVGLRVSMPMTRKQVTWAPSPGSLINRLRVAIGDFGGLDIGSRKALALNGPADTGLFLRPDSGWAFLPAFLHWRTLLVNRNHSLFRAATLAAADDINLAAFGLAQALLDTEGIEPERAFTRMLDSAADHGGHSP